MNVCSVLRDVRIAVSIDMTPFVNRSQIPCLELESCMIEFTHANRVIEDTHTLVTPLAWLVTFAEKDCHSDPPAKQ